MIAKYLFGSAVSGAILTIFCLILFRGIAGDAGFAEGIVGGALIPIFEQIINYFFRKTGPGEAPTNGA